MTRLLTLFICGDDNLKHLKKGLANAYSVTAPASMAGSDQVALVHDAEGYIVAMLDYEPWIPQQLRGKWPRIADATLIPSDARPVWIYTVYGPDCWRRFNQLISVIQDPEIWLLLERGKAFNTKEYAEAVATDPDFMSAFGDSLDAPLPQGVQP
jgi:hypothetical protein